MRICLVSGISLIFLCIGSVDFSSKCCKRRSALFHVYFAVLAVGGNLSSFSADSDHHKGSKCKESAKFWPLCMVSCSYMKSRRVG